MKQTLLDIDSLRKLGQVHCPRRVQTRIKNLYRVFGHDLYVICMLCVPARYRIITVGDTYVILQNVGDLSNEIEGLNSNSHVPFMFRGFDVLRIIKVPYIDVGKAVTKPFIDV